MEQKAGVRYRHAMAPGAEDDNPDGVNAAEVVRRHLKRSAAEEVVNREAVEHRTSWAGDHEVQVLGTVHDLLVYDLE